MFSGNLMAPDIGPLNSGDRGLLAESLWVVQGVGRVIPQGSPLAATWAG